MRAKVFAVTAALAAAAFSAPASAARYVFDLTGSRTANFTLESTKPDFFSAYQTQFRNVSGSFAGAPGVASAISFGAVFFISALDVSGTSLGFAQFGGPELFTGSTSNPVFTVGTFALSGIVSGNSTLTITAAPSVVAEPATWLLMIGGFGMIGFTMRQTLQARHPLTI